MILKRLDLPLECRALDIGGVAYNGQESTRFIAEQFSGQIDAIRPKARDVDAFVTTFGERAQLLDNLPPANSAPYDLVVLAPNSMRTFADLRHFTVTRSPLVRAGGFLICHGLRPESIESDEFLKAPDEVIEEFKFSFDFIDPYTAVLPSYLAGFQWFGLFPRKTRSRSYLAWYVFQKLDAVAGGPKPAPKTEQSSNRILPGLVIGPADAKRPPTATRVQSVGFAHSVRIRSLLGASKAAPIETTAVRGPVGRAASAVTSPTPAFASGSARDSDSDSVIMADMLGHVKRFGPEEYRPVLDEIKFQPLPADVVELLSACRFDTLMFVNNAFEGDARVMKTGQAVHSFGRSLLAVGLSKGASYGVRQISEGPPLVLVPNHISTVSKSLKKHQFPLDVGPRYEIWMACAAVYIAWLLIKMADKPSSIIVHSHDFMGAYAGGNAVRLAGAHPTMSGTSLKWIHDIHDFVQQYDIIDPTLQKIGCLWEEALYPHADALSTVSGTLADHLMRYYRLRSRPTIIYNSNRLSARFKYKGPGCREYVGCGTAPLLVHSGSIRPGRGVEYAIEALKHVVDAHLLLLSGSDSPYLATLFEQADEWGVRSRIHMHPLLPYDEVAGFIADATAGVIPMEHYGNADVALPNKLFDYINAEIPIISADTDNIKVLMSEWRIGRLFPAKNVGALVEAIRDVADNQELYRATIRSRPDLVLSFAWEAQVMKLYDMYRGLNALAHSSYQMGLPQY